MMTTVALPQPQDGGDLPRWQYALHEVDTMELRTYITKWNELGAEGWEMIGMAPMSKTMGFLERMAAGARGGGRPGITNRMVYVFKRRLV